MTNHIFFVKFYEVFSLIPSVLNTEGSTAEIKLGFFETPNLFTNPNI